jgi:gas vesicle structural protein
MTQSMSGARGGYLDRPSPSSLADVVEMILDKGLVIDAYVRVSVIGIELMTIDARVVIASVDTYLRFAEKTNRLDLYEHGTPIDELPSKMKHKALEGAAEGVWTGVKDEVKETAAEVKDALIGKRRSR